MARQASPTPSNWSDSSLSQDALVERYLYFKARCLNLVSASLSQQDQCDEEPTFIAVVLLALLDLIESGSGSWIFHLEGAKRLLEAGIKRGQSELQKGPRVMLHDIIL